MLRGGRRGGDGDSGRGIDVPVEQVCFTTSAARQPKRLTGEWAADEFGNIDIGEQAPVIRMRFAVRVLGRFVAVC